MNEDVTLPAPAIAGPGPGPLFDPEQGVVIAEPVGQGEGYWAGAPGAFYDAPSGNFYLTYRIRRPRGVQPDRGGECRLLAGRDGIHFQPIWSCTKDQLDTASLERFAISRSPEGRWLLYLCYVDPGDSRWRIDLVEADAPDRFDVARRTEVFTAGPLGLEGIKDPYIYRAGPAYFMIVSVAERVADAQQADHSTADAYATGTVLAHTALAVSGDGRRFDYVGRILSARGADLAWDGYGVRLNCILRAGAIFTGLYDGCRSLANHYDGATGLAASFDLRNWHTLTPDAPVLRSPHGLGCLRYTDVLAVEGRRYFYYEYGRPDGSHDLRVSVTDTG